MTQIRLYHLFWSKSTPAMSNFLWQKWPILCNVQFPVAEMANPLLVPRVAKIFHLTALGQLMYT